MALGSSGPIETKVSAATVAAVVSAFIAWVLRTYVFHGDVPPEVEALVTVVIVALSTFAAGWLSPHTPRGDRDAIEAGRHERP